MGDRSVGNVLRTKCPLCMTKMNCPTIGCSRCHIQCHLICLGIVSDPPVGIEVFYCYSCEKRNKIKTIINKDHLSFLEDLFEEPERNGSKKFIEDFQKKQFLSAEDIPITKLSGREVKLSYFEINGFENPIFIKSPIGLGIKVPGHDFSFKDLLQHVGPLKEILVIDVSRQKEQVMYLRELIEYLHRPEKPKIINVLSLEISSTRLSDFVSPPELVLKTSWVTNHWRNLSGHAEPEVQKYCLISMAGSYTDFHIDFSGSSVWYHIVRGEKKFYLVQPTPENLEKFREWMNDERQSYKCFADQVDCCYEVIIKQGETIFIPSGWIHAVLTPVDSLVFGGNFLNSFNVEMQFKIYDLEEKLSTASKYTFPSFQPLNWLVAHAITSDVFGRHRKPVKKYLLENLKCLYPHLMKWSKDTEHPPPLEIGHADLLEDLEGIIGGEWEDVKNVGSSSGVVHCNVVTDHEPHSKKKKRRSGNAFIRS